MGALPKNKWLAASTLAIILPLSLLATFKLTGIINEPQKPETIRLEPTSWNMERPSYHITIGKKIEKSYVNEGLSVVFGVVVGEYLENAELFDFRDGLLSRVYFNATVTSGDLFSAAIHIQPIETNSDVAIPIHRDSLSTEIINVDLTNYKNDGVKDAEAYAKVKITGSPCYLNIPTFWEFWDEDTTSHGLNITNEILYRSDSGYKNVVATFILEVVVDAGNNFDSPNVRPIGFGSYLASIHLGNDPVDLYKIQLEEGESIIINLSPPSTLDLDLCLYDSNITPIASAYSRGCVPEQLEFIVDKTGFWFIMVTYYNGSYGTYTLNINEKS
jgi:hypothetical protein